MKKYSFIILVVVTLSIVLFACNNEIEDNLLNETIELEELQEIPQIVEFDSYSASLGDFFAEIQKINSTKDIEQIKELVNLNVLAEYSPEEYQESLEKFFYSIYTKEEIERLNQLRLIVSERKSQFLSSSGFKKLTENELNILNESLAFEMPELKNNLKIRSFQLAKTRSEPGNGNSCISACESAYYDDLKAIALAFICYSAITIAEVCLSGGSWTLNALIEIVSQITTASLQMKMAEMEYDLCLDNCH